MAYIDEATCEKTAIGFLTAVYTVIYLSLAIALPFPSWYRPAVQSNMKYVADTLASGGNPYVPPYPTYYSTAGGNLHGVLGAPFKWVFDFSQSPRLAVVIMGWISLIVLYLILKDIGVRKWIALSTVGFLMAYPHYLFFYSQGNPAAADIFFGLISIYSYLRWQTNKSNQWLLMSVAGVGLATFSHFYAGVIGVGIVLHFTFVGSNTAEKLKLSVVYAAGMIPALGLFIAYKSLFATQDPNSHYIDMLIINSFDQLYLTNENFGSGFPVYSIEFLNALLRENGHKSPIFGHWWLTGITSVTIGSKIYDNISKDSWVLILSWIVSGLLIIIIIPGGAIYHDYYTWWLLLGVVAGLALSLETALPINKEDYDNRDIILNILVVSSVILVAIICIMTDIYWLLRLVT